MKERIHQICTNCIMDTSDPNISFDNNGVCNYCNNFKNNLSKNMYKGHEGNQKLLNLIKEIKAFGKDKEYDCIIGLSGGIDSSYLALLGSKLGLRMLAVHVDAGWNTELAVQNIENLCKKLNLDLHTEVVNWSIMRKVQLAFLKSGLVNQDIPQDNAFFAALHKYARNNKIKYVLNGTNYATENTLPVAWGGEEPMDSRLIKSVYKKFNNDMLRDFPIVNYWQYYVLKSVFKTYATVDLLNYIDYSKDFAISELEKEVGFKPYKGKHNESRFTKFHQNYYLVKKFGFQKRRAHLASLVISEQLERTKALQEMEKPIYSSHLEEEEEVEYIIKKLYISKDEFDDIMKMEPFKITDFSSDQVLHQKIKPITSKIRKFVFGEIPLR
jgi:N-acetyl sugar amidotransferase